MGADNDEKFQAYKTKAVNFLGRSVPIILQNDNGPCPLIAICNVLLLRNNITLRKESSEISLQNLLTLIAERLLDSNSHTEDKDENYIQNQQQNISDAISLLPRLATGIDVNVRFRNIYDFEFTPECAIFDLLDIGLVHGWLYDPQDENTSKAVGSNSYNVLVEKLVALHSAKRDIDEEPTVDFAAATTASLGVPSPGRCSKQSFEGLQLLDFSEQIGNGGSHEETEATELSDETKKARKGDEEEAAQLLVALDLSKVSDISDADSPPDSHNGTSEAIEIEGRRSSGSEGLKQWPSLRVLLPENDRDAATTTDSLASAVEDNGWLVKVDRETESSVHASTSSDFECLEVDDCRTASSNFSGVEGEKMESATADSIAETSTDAAAAVEGGMTMDEPLYEGETNFQSFEGEEFEDREPLYEGEAVLVNAEPSGRDNFRTTETEALTIENFLSIHASQLTYYGLFSLQEGLKERELCVFFRNNHFSTMFKYEGDLYLLVTDQGYLNEPDLVWEKLTEVDGDSVFLTGNFGLFKVDEQQNLSSWNERDAMAATADYISSQLKTDQVQQNDASYNSDLQLAMALQQQEFEQQQQQQQPPPPPPQQQKQQQQQQHQPQQQQQSPRKTTSSPRKGSSSRPSSGLSTGKLFTGPSSSPPPKQESKTKEKCKMM